MQLTLMLMLMITAAHASSPSGVLPRMNTIMRHTFGSAFGCGSDVMNPDRASSSLFLTSLARQIALPDLLLLPGSSCADAPRLGVEQADTPSNGSIAAFVAIAELPLMNVTRSAIEYFGASDFFESRTLASDTTFGVVSITKLQRSVLAVRVVSGCLTGADACVVEYVVETFDMFPSVDGAAVVATFDRAGTPEPSIDEDTTASVKVCSENFRPMRKIFALSLAGATFESLNSNRESTQIFLAPAGDRRDLYVSFNIQSGLQARLAHVTDQLPFFAEIGAVPISQVSAETAWKAKKWQQDQFLTLPANVTFAVFITNRSSRVLISLRAVDCAVEERSNDQVLSAGCYVEYSLLFASAGVFSQHQDPNDKDNVDCETPCLPGKELYYVRGACEDGFVVDSMPGTGHGDSEPGPADNGTATAILDVLCPTAIPVVDKCAKSCQPAARTMQGDICPSVVCSLECIKAAGKMLNCGDNLAGVYCKGDFSKFPAEIRNRNLTANFIVCSCPASVLSTPVTAGAVHLVANAALAVVAAIVALPLS